MFANESQVSISTGANVERMHSPFIAVNNIPVIGPDGQPITLHDLLETYRVEKIKLPKELRLILLDNIDPNKSKLAPVELPFTRNDNTIAAEIFWGLDRFLFFEDPETKNLLRMIPIPMESADTDDPEKYIVVM